MKRIVHITKSERPKQIFRFKKVFFHLIDDILQEEIVIGVPTQLYRYSSPEGLLTVVPYPNGRLTHINGVPVYYDAKPPTQVEMNRVKKDIPEFFI